MLLVPGSFNWCGYRPFSGVNRHSSSRVVGKPMLLKRAIAELRRRRRRGVSLLATCFSSCSKWASNWFFIETCSGLGAIVFIVHQFRVSYAGKYFGVFQPG